MSNLDELNAIAQKIGELSEKKCEVSECQQICLILGKLSGILRILNINSFHNEFVKNIDNVMKNYKDNNTVAFYYIAVLIEIIGDYYLGNSRGENVRVKFKRYRKKKSEKEEEKETYEEKNEEIKEEDQNGGKKEESGSPQGESNVS